MSYLWTKILGVILCVAFLATLKPLLRLLSLLVGNELRPHFLKELDLLGAGSDIPGSVILALVGGVIVWITVSIKADPVFGDASIVIGALAGFAVLYPYFFLMLSERARLAFLQQQLERRD